MKVSEYLDFILRSLLSFDTVGTSIGSKSLNLRKKEDVKFSDLFLKLNELKETLANFYHSTVGLFRNIEYLSKLQPILYFSSFHDVASSNL